MKINIIKSVRKTLSIEIKNNSEIIVRAPRFAPKRYIDYFIKKHQPWIEKKLKNIEESPQYSNLFKPDNGNYIFFKGQKIDINRVFSEKSKLVYSDNSINLYTTNDEAANNSIIKFYKKEGKRHLSQRIQELAEQFYYSYTSVRITSAKTRWGSCSYKNSINLSYRLMMLPVWVSDYVIIHELVHTKIKNHSKHFWTEVNQVCPDYNNAKQWIKQHQHEFNL